MSMAIDARVAHLVHRAEMEFGSTRNGLKFRGRCECGWTSAWYLRSGMVAAVIGAHKAESKPTGRR